MKKSRFADSQIQDAIKHVEAGMAVPELCREVGTSTATSIHSHNPYGREDC